MVSHAFAHLAPGGFFFFLVVVVAGAWVIRKLWQSTDRLDELEGRMRRMETQWAMLMRERDRQPAKPDAAQPGISKPPVAAPPIVSSVGSGGVPPVVVPPHPEQAPVAISSIRPAGDIPPPMPVWASPSEMPPPPAVKTPEPFAWENFLGAKLSAWLGGLVTFLTVAYFVKYSFENNLISPQMRLAIGFLAGVGLLAGGLMMSRQKYAVMVQSLCSSGVLVLYGTGFAAHAYYHLIGPVPAFGLMVLITMAAFLLAVRLDAQVVAVLGLIGGFLTPMILSTGADNPAGLFSYVAILDIGLVAVALRQRWQYLILMAAVATVCMQAGWADRFLCEEKALTAMTVYCGFAVFFSAVCVTAWRQGRQTMLTGLAVLAPAFAALVLAFYFVAHPYPRVCAKPWLLFTHLFLADACLIPVALIHQRGRPAFNVAGGFIFLLLTVWVFDALTTALLNWALGCFLVFAVLHSLFPVILQRFRPGAGISMATHIFPPVALLLMMVPILKHADASLFIWPCILLVDALAVGLAVLTASMASIAAVLVLTILAVASWILRTPPTLADLPVELALIGGFALFFFGVGLVAGRKILAKLQLAGPSGAGAAQSNPALSQIPALSAIMPFLLLMMVCLRLPPADPSPVFGLAALLTVLLFGLVLYHRADAVGGVALVCVLILQHIWHERSFASATSMSSLLWAAGFAAMFFLFPFLFRRHLQSRAGPWAVSALSLPAHFYLLHDLVKTLWPNPYMGLLPALLVLPCLTALMRLSRKTRTDLPSRNALLALYGGAALFFVTLIFPIQFSNQWWTLGWALEGAALLWFYHRVPHPGLRMAGAGLLLAAFVRLGLNPEIFNYYERSGYPILNWYLYSYGVVAACLLAGARWLAAPPDAFGAKKGPGILQAMGTVLLFMLLNIEIADYFCEGTRLRFYFSASLAQDMTCSIGWAFFALILLGVGIRLNRAAARYAGLGLLVVAVCKLFLHDLWRLRELYRVGSLLGLALTLMLVSFIYQRFIARQSSKGEKPHEN
ncbi:MAG: DUF2339 domain-containing protein [Verrucomicrobiae bacterium]|nr:DUF2339 domain-containing protein [Verrucomicrobiae bacterium]